MAKKWGPPRTRIPHYCSLSTNFSDRIVTDKKGLAYTVYHLLLEEFKEGRSGRRTSAGGDYCLPQKSIILYIFLIFHYFFWGIFTQHRLWPFIVTRDQHTIHRRVQNPDCWVRTNLTQLNPFVFSFGNLTAKKIVVKRTIHNKECASLISISHNN